ncbi:unnamed protein product [Soboliphyme baturini]|uniref:Brix domain-containing protein n=1 Tax=Soboliphyme baturini TaxID=241478 RepID=A0A183J865_9BILA|nr:unnamed protein product [Soboliphyme baturini]
MKPTVEPSDFAGGRKLVDFERKERARSIRIEKRKEKKKRQDERRKIREALGDKAPPKLQPKTIENTREQDVTMVDPADEEVIQDEALDEMSTYFNRVTKPKVLITISPGAKQETWKFCHELHNCIPNSDMYSRKSCPMKKVVKRAIEEGFTDIIVINEDRRIPNAMTICHLPSGPTAYFRLRSIQRSKELKRHGAITDHYPEVILNNFNTRLGHTVGRMLACLFPYDPQFRGRRVVTFHNQRDYIFFRHHRYEFKNGGKRAALLELGPRFTLRLRSLQKGTFDTKFGEYEWILKRHEMEASRRRFVL